MAQGARILSSFRRLFVKRFVVALVGLLALFTFIRDYSGGSATAQSPKATVMSAEIHK